MVEIWFFHRKSGDSHVDCECIRFPKQLVYLKLISDKKSGMHLIGLQERTLSVKLANFQSVHLLGHKLTTLTSSMCVCC